MRNSIYSPIAKEFGLNSMWNGEDRDELTRVQKGLWQDYKKRFFEENKEEIKDRLLREKGRLSYFSSESFPLEYIPGFVESLDELHNVHGYGLTDIGIMFGGLSIERVRQYFEKYDLERHEAHGAMYRVWSDEENRFVTISSNDLGAKLIQLRKERREDQREERNENEKQKHLEAFRDFKEEHKRDPNIRELSESLGIPPESNGMSCLARFWGYDYGDEENDTTHKEAIDNLYRAAGSEERRHLESVTHSRISEREPNTIGARLTEKRIRFNLSQENIAYLLDLSQFSISGHERNRFKPREGFKIYAELYGVSENWLLTGED